MEDNVYFGVHVNNTDDTVDYKSLIARLLLCPHITCDHVLYFMDKLEKGELPYSKVVEVADMGYIDFTYLTPDIATMKALDEKIKEWQKVIASLTQEDYEYLEEHYGFTEATLAIKDISNKAFNSPKELASIVKQYIKGQDEAIDRLAVVFYMHYISRKNETDSIMRSVLTIGPTGSGKSEIYRRFALLCDFPVLTVNSCHITPVGWKGPSLSDIVNQYKITKGLSDDDMKYLVVVLTEFDKIAHYKMRTDSDYDADQMRQIMQLMDKGNQIVLENGINIANGTNQMCKLCTDNWLVVLDGAFSGLEEIVKKRLNLTKTFGFTKPSTQEFENTNLLQQVSRNDLVQWGFMEEVIGRINYICALNTLTKEVIYQILVEAKDNILQSHVEISKLCNIDLKFTDAALQLIADDANQKSFGFRSVPFSVTDIMIPIYFEHCSINNTEEKQTVIIDEEYVKQQLNSR